MRAARDYLDSDESEGLAQFLVEMVALEEAVDIALASFYAAPERAEDFYHQFLRTMTLGNKIDRLRPVAALHAASDLIEDIRAVVLVRNAVAHGSPTTDWTGIVTDDGDDSDIETYRVYRTAQREIDARTLKDWARAAGKISMTISRLHRAELETPDATL